ncbi:MAG TPA: cysteine-rich CWC family protein [Dehalococcoidales bacterium]|nr:cysteine-rich CWC family protein [Dehalococcoidales bacterium]
MIDKKTCPICGRPNDCRHDLFQLSGEQCWCASLKISPAVFKRIPSESLGLACVCRSCIEKYQ